MRVDGNALALAPPYGLGAYRGRVAEEDFVSMKWPELPAETRPALTAAEREVLALLVGGATNLEIAAARGTSPRTVANQVSVVFGKFGAHSRAELAARVPADRACASWSRASPQETLELWNGLVNGSWCTVDREERDGRTFLLARRNASGVPRPKGLTAAERDVVAFAARGRSNKFIAYMLGLSPSTIAEHLRNAERKLGLSSRCALVRRFAHWA